MTDWTAIQIRLNLEMDNIREQIDGEYAINPDSPDLQRLKDQLKGIMIAIQAIKETK